jgi:hypothetical protein
MCGVNNYMKRWHYRDTAKCPRCGHIKETARHVNICPQPSALQHWEKSMETLEAWLVKRHMHPMLITLLPTTHHRNGGKSTSTGRYWVGGPTEWEYGPTMERHSTSILPIPSKTEHRPPLGPITNPKTLGRRVGPMGTKKRSGTPSSNS